MPEEYFCLPELISENTIGAKITNLRISKGMYKLELAKLLEVGETTLRNYENNNIKPSLERLEKLCEIFDLPLDYNCFSEDIEKCIKKIEVMNDYKKIGEKIRKERVNSGLYIKDLANQVNIPIVTMRLIEVGERKVKKDTLIKICAVLKIPIDYFESYIDVIEN